MVMDFLPGRTLEEADVHCGNWKLLEQIASRLFEFHRQEIPMAAMGEPMLWRTMEKMLLVVDGQSLPAKVPSLAEIRRELALAREALERFEPKVVCGHGDFKPSNVIAHEGEVWLIDFELGGPNYRGFDWMKLFRRPEGVSQKAASSGVDEMDLPSLLRETLVFEPLTWLEAFVFFLALPQYKLEDLPKWQQLAEHRWEMYQQTRYRLLPEA
ncbi:Probable ethanolamine kinase (Protein EMBRYO DEFECTIVE 1187) [Durusdinium trenchii]|uniref:ethanolamine kinase n=1 Tax=Durusdinium trenchii TaxID=1381693 RepID=A0ABP0KE47_9DINO